MSSEQIQIAPPAQGGLPRRLVRFFIASLLCLHLLFFFNQRERIQRGYPDFTVFYTGASMLRQGLGRQLYDERTQFRVQQEFTGGIDSRSGPLPYIHPPYEALVFLPLTWLSYAHAFAVWDGLNVFLLLLVAGVLRRHLQVLRRIPAWEFTLAFLAFFPVFATFLQGQDSILLLLLCTLGFSALKRNSDFLAGGWFALGVFKFQLVLPLVLLLFLWKRRRVAAGFCVVALLLTLLSMAIVGWDGVWGYPAYLLKVAQETGLGGVPPELLPNLHGLVMGWNFVTDSRAATVLALAASFGLVLLAWKKGDTPKPQRTTWPTVDLQFSLAVVVAVAVSWQSNAHDFALLILPAVLLADYCWTTNAIAPWKSRVLLPSVPLMISPLWIVLWLRYGKVNLLAIPLLWWMWEIGEEASRVTARSCDSATAQ